MNTSEEIAEVWTEAHEENQKIDNRMDLETAWLEAAADRTEPA